MVFFRSLAKFSQEFHLTRRSSFLFVLMAIPWVPSLAHSDSPPKSKENLCGSGVDLFTFVSAARNPRQLYIQLSEEIKAQKEAFGECIKASKSGHGIELEYDSVTIELRLRRDKNGKLEGFSPLRPMEKNQSQEKLLELVKALPYTVSLLAIESEGNTIFSYGSDLEQELSRAHHIFLHYAIREEIKAGSIKERDLLPIKRSGVDFGSSKRWRQGKKISVEKLIEFLVKEKDPIAAMMVLDLIGDKKLEQLGLKKLGDSWFSSGKSLCNAFLAVAEDTARIHPLYMDSFRQSLPDFVDNYSIVQVRDPRIALSISVFQQKENQKKICVFSSAHAEDGEIEEREFYPIFMRFENQLFRKKSP